MWLLFGCLAVIWAIAFIIRLLWIWPGPSDQVYRPKHGPLDL